MKQFETVEQYLQDGFEPDQRIVLAGYGILDGLNAVNKSTTYKTVRIKQDGDLVLKAYRGRNELKLPTYRHDQKVQVLTEQEFNNLN